MPSKVKNNLAILSYHEKRIQLEHEVQQRYENLSEEAQAVIRDAIREFIRRSAMPVRIIYAQEFVEELENKLFEKSQAFQKLSDIHKRALTEHNDQLDYSWKDGYEKGVRDANATHQAHAKTNLQIKKNLSVQVADLQKQNADLAHQVPSLKFQLENKPKPIVAEIGSTFNEGFVVRNWRDSKKWISNWCFGLIAFLAVTPIPPEVLIVLPENVRYYLIAFTAFCGFLGRYINQTKPVPLPPINAGDADV